MKQTAKLSVIALATILSLGACKQGEKSGETKSASASQAAPQSASASQNSKSDLGSPAQQASYAMGVDIGRSLKQMKDQGTEIDMKMFNEAVQTMIDGKQPKMTEQQAQEVMMAFLAEQQKKAQTKATEDAKTNLTKGEAFLKDNATKSGVKTTASGLQYKVNKEGTGKQPKKTDVVTVAYEGRLIDGTVFDSSKMHGNEPVTFPLDQVIPGWTEGVQLMKEGGEYTFYVPAKLAYGERAMGDKIGPNSTLVFDVTLLKVGAPDNKPAVQK